MRPDHKKAVYGAKLVKLITDALQVAGVQGIEQIGHVSNFQPFNGVDGREGAFLDVGVWMAADADVKRPDASGSYLEEINQAVMRVYYRRGTCCACKSDMSYNAHHWSDCPLREFKAILAPAFAERWFQAERNHVEENNRARQNRG